MSNFILFGFKACGKTYWGKRLAQAMGLSFIDTDERIEDLYFKQHGEKLLCRDIYGKIGAKAFRMLEYQVIVSLEGVTNSIIALGGGTILYSKNRKILEKMGLFIHLIVDKETLKKRIVSQAPSALLGERGQYFEKAYRVREPLYQKISSRKVQLEGKKEHQILQMLTEITHGV